MAWPKGGSPKEIGTRVAERFVATPHTNFGRPAPPGSITYPETCTWYGALTFAQLSRNKALTRKLIARFEPLFGAEAHLIPTADHVDPSVFVENGMWRELIDRPEAWPETSCTGMFTFAMVTGVKQGWLQAAPYPRAASKGWLGLIDTSTQTPTSARCVRARTKRTITSTTSIANATSATCMGRSQSYGAPRPCCAGDRRRRDDRARDGRRRQGASGARGTACLRRLRALRPGCAARCRSNR
ncbi:MAG: glycosyl hydrolase [Gammaproteobacteria bacterium]|nr:glycosyl hydrolase [Gammaproteobacteria bacterium]